MLGILLLSLAASAVALIGIVIWRAHANHAALEAARRKRLYTASEQKRIEECGETVLFFANHLGYIARPAISRFEIGKLIDSGITAPELSAEICRRIDSVDGLVLGYQSFGQSQVDVKLTDSHRQRHVYVVGKSGSGKTNLLRQMILQDIEAGCGVGVIAPEREMLTEEILPFIPDYRTGDLIYFDPADEKCQVSFNPLHIDAGEDFDVKVDENLTVFKRVIDDLSPRMEELLRQTLYALTGRTGATLLDVERLLDRTDSSFRQEIINSATDEQLVRFWRDTYPSYPKDAHLPVITRLGRLLRPRAVRNALCSTSPGLDFRAAMDEGKILLFNLSEGVLGEQVSQTLGQLIVSKFQLAVMSRANSPKTERRDFHLYLDEFQTFTGTAGASYERMLSRARKYHLSLTLAHQQTGQLPTDLMREILGNVSTCICFQVGREDAARFSKEFTTMYDGEVERVPESEFLKLKVGEAWCRIGQHSFPMRTYLADEQAARGRAEEVIRGSYDNYQYEMRGSGVTEEQRAMDDGDATAQASSYAAQAATAASIPSFNPSPVTAATAAVAASSGNATSAQAIVNNVLDELDPSDLFGD